MSALIHTWLPLVMTRWRQARRMFDSRLLNERRLIIVAAVALAWFVLDTALVTPSYKAFHAAVQRGKTTSEARDTLKDQITRVKTDMGLKEAEARQEVKRIRERIESGKKALAQHQSMLVPARDMQPLLEGLLTQNGQLRLIRMRTLAPEEVKFAPVPGVSFSQALLYRQRMEVTVGGGFMEMLAWLRSIEDMPRKLLWDGLTLRHDEAGQLSLTLIVHTFSPDRDALEIAP